MQPTPHLLASDAEVRISLGPLHMTVRGFVLGLLALPITIVILLTPHLWLPLRLVLAGLCEVFAIGLSLPTQEGVWKWTYHLFGLGERAMPNHLQAGDPVRVRIARYDQSGAIGITPGPWWIRALRLPTLMGQLARVPRVDWSAIEPGLFRRDPGGWSAILCLDGPSVPTGSPEYQAWCRGLLTWVLSIGVPAQIYAEASHYAPTDVRREYEARVSEAGCAWTNFHTEESRLVADVARATLVVRLYAVFLPGSAGPDGRPHGCDWKTLLDTVDASRSDADRCLAAAVNSAESCGLEARACPAEELRQLLDRTLLGRAETKYAHGLVQARQIHHACVAVTALPPAVTSGSVIDAFTRSNIRGVASLHLYPVEPPLARKELDSLRGMYEWSASHTRDRAAAMAADQISGLQTLLISREASLLRAGLAFRVSGHTPAEADEAIDQLRSSLLGPGFRAVRVTRPGFRPALATVPGGTPLARTLIATTDDVVADLLPSIGTPFADPTQCLVGVNVATGASVYLSVFDGEKPNHNCVIVGSSGAGKSVAGKVLTYREHSFGARTIMIDPDDEFKLLTQVQRGRYVEIGQDALNPLAVPGADTPEQAANRVLPILSVMAGAPVGFQRGGKSGTPVRRLAEEDKAMLFELIQDFYTLWWDDRRTRGREPVVQNLVTYLRQAIQKADILGSHEEMHRRFTDLTLRLHSYTQGDRGLIFNRETTTSLSGHCLAIGLKFAAHRYEADLSPILAIALSHTIGEMLKREGPLIIMVDEAHRIMNDPEASIVVDWLAREARKYDAGFWLASQKVEDFTETELGSTVASIAATKLVLGVEAIAADAVQRTFMLTDREMRYLTPKYQQGRGVLISGHERAVVDICPGDHLLHVVSTSPGRPPSRLGKVRIA